MREVTWNENVIAADDRRQHRLLAPGPAPAAPAALGRAPALPRRRARRVARAAAARARTPHVINPEQGWLDELEQPAVGRLDQRRRARRASASPARCTASGSCRSWSPRSPATRATSARRRSSETSGTTAQQFPFVDRAPAAPGGEARRRRRAGRRSRALLAWDGNYATTDAGGHGRPGRRDLGGVQGPARGDRCSRPMATPAAADLAGVDRPLAPVRHHQRRVAGPAHARRRAPTRAPRTRPRPRSPTRFGSADPAAWREPRRMYEVIGPGRRLRPRPAVLRPRHLGPVGRARAADDSDRLAHEALHLLGNLPDAAARGPPVRQRLQRAHATPATSPRSSKVHGLGVGPKLFQHDDRRPQARSRS